MASSYQTPGVYIQELNSFPASVIAAPTAIPVFIGYTEKAQQGSKSLLRVPTLIGSLAEYQSLFGGAFRPVYALAAAPVASADTVPINGRPFSLTLNAGSTAYLYNSIRLFFENGGGFCYILPIGLYGGSPGGFTVSAADFLGGAGKPSAFSLLAQPGPTLVVLPDANALGTAAYPIYQQALLHCQTQQDRFAILDVALPSAADDTATAISDFRAGIGVNGLSYGAAYYPWLNTAIVQPGEIGHWNLDPATDLGALLPEPAAKAAVASYRALPEADHTGPAAVAYEQALLAASPTYQALRAALLQRVNLLPPSGAMAGIYTYSDETRGVWKAPANTPVNRVVAPFVNLTDTQQSELNVDPVSGKSVNAIRAFRGAGVLVWGARTLDGNSFDWRYVPVRRTVLMIEQSIRQALQAFAFTPNTATTWSTVKDMVTSFLTGLWKQGALAGAVPDDAFSVQVGLGSTMTPTDILNNVMLLTVQVAITRPAEFIVLTFRQQLQAS